MTPGKTRRHTCRVSVLQTSCRCVVVGHHIHRSSSQRWHELLNTLVVDVVIMMCFKPPGRLGGLCFNAVFFNSPYRISEIFNVKSNAMVDVTFIQPLKKVNVILVPIDFSSLNSNFCCRMHRLATIYNVTDDRATDGDDGRNTVA